MEFDANIEYLRMAFWQIFLAAGPILGTALVVGLVIGVVQAATSINEQTLSFVPKLIIVLGVFALLSGYILTGLTDYFAFVFDEIRHLQ
ncbi:flagellar biosynthesis protein FliQ [Cypionkella sp.]|jgi:flagellar biosynthesis protein FliQ|uniref:flagellar biosynthesis protein FliQ n=1 Tax=Cypionkella sp. TaxID=2811411 RepID=UPI002FDDC3F7